MQRLASAVIIGAALISRTAGATTPCGGPFATSELLAPMPEETNVPRNVTILARSGDGAFGFGGRVDPVADGVLELVDVDTSTAVFPASVVVTPVRSGAFIEIRPITLLAANRTYELRTNSERGPLSPGVFTGPLSFTTGEAVDEDPPPAPIDVRAEGIELSGPGGCGSPGLELVAGDPLSPDTRILFAVQTNRLPINEDAMPELGAGATPRVEVLVGEGDAPIQGEIFAIDLAGNRSAPVAFSAETPPESCGCTSAGGEQRSGAMVLGLLALLALGRRRS